MRELIKQIESVNGVTEANLWEKGSYCRIYINFESQNRFPATGSAKVYIENRKVVHNVTKKECSGAATFRNVMDAIEEIENII